jgi:hypothetical protein
MSGVGKTYTAALCAGGREPSPSVLLNTESWNGSSWTELNDMNSARVGAAGQTGTSVSNIAVGGYSDATTSVVGNTEDWNGVSWQETTDLSTARSAVGGAGADSTSALLFGGYATSDSTLTEEWSSTSNTTKTISTD